MWNYMCIRWLINWSDSTKIHGATIRFHSFCVTTHCIRAVKSTENFNYCSSGVGSSDVQYELLTFERVKLMYTVYKDDLPHKAYSVVPLNRPICECFIGK